MRRRGLVSCLVIAAAGIAAAQAPSAPGVAGFRSDRGHLAERHRAAVVGRDGRGDEARRRPGAQPDAGRHRLAGHVHERYQQYANGIRVVGGEITRQSAGGVTTSIFGELQQVSGVADRPDLSEDAARDRFRALSPRQMADDRPIELVILTKDDGSHALAYTTHVWTAAGWMRTYLDATSGEVLLQYNDMQTPVCRRHRHRRARRHQEDQHAARLGPLPRRRSAAAAGPDHLRHAGQPAQTDRYLDGIYVATTSDIASDSDNVWTDGASVDAHVYLGYTYDYYFKRFGRKGLDDRNAPIYAMTHPVQPQRLRRPCRTTTSRITC